MKHLPSLSGFFKEHAPGYGGEVILEPQYGYAGCIKFPNGNISYFKYNHIDINTVGASEIAKDKDYCAYFLCQLGYNTIPGKTFYSDEWAGTIQSDQTIDKAIGYISSIGYPVFIKPNSSGLGYGVARIDNETQIETSLSQAFLFDKIILIQKAVENMIDIRVVVFAGEVICAYKKESLSIIGDGISTIEKLFEQKINTLKNNHREISVTLDDYRTKSILEKRNLTAQSVLKDGEKLYLLYNANLSQGADGFDISNTMSDSWKKWAIKLAHDCNLALCGIDILVKNDMQHDMNKEDYVILEINSSPGLGHYKTLSNEAREKTEQLYKKILEYLSHEK